MRGQKVAARLVGQPEIMHPAHIVHLPLFLASSDFLAQVGQRDVGAVLRDQVLLAVLAFPHFSQIRRTVSPDDPGCVPSPRHGKMMPANQPMSIALGRNFAELAIFYMTTFWGRGCSMRQNGRSSRAKARQTSKLAEIRRALIAAGCDTTAKQAAVLGICRSTTWALLNSDKRAGPSAIIIKRILSSPILPVGVRLRFEEYVEDKIQGRYGHSERRAHAFRVALDSELTQPTH